MRVHILILSSIWVGGDLILTELKGVIVCVSPEEPGPCPKAALLVLFYFYFFLNICFLLLLKNIFIWLCWS